MVLHQQLLHGSKPTLVWRQYEYGTSRTSGQLQQRYDSSQRCLFISKEYSLEYVAKTQKFSIKPPRNLRVKKRFRFPPSAVRLQHDSTLLHRDLTSACPRWSVSGLTSASPAGLYRVCLWHAPAGPYRVQQRHGSY